MYGELKKEREKPLQLYTYEDMRYVGNFSVKAYIVIWSRTYVRKKCVPIR